ncbi:MAG: hypothetical protein WC435_02575 [Candidatus Paceibacterota bacterium]
MNMRFFDFPNKIKFPALFIAIILLAYLFWRIVLVGGSFVPKEFLEANQQGALIATQIVDFSKKSVSNIDKINDLDREENYSEALNLIMEEISRNEEMKKEAYNLSFELAKMAETLKEIKPKVATETALRGINYETSLIIRLINYNAFMGNLLITLRDKFTGKMVEEGKVGEIIKKINDEATAINDLNEQYKAAMNEFDEKIK